MNSCQSIEKKERLILKDLEEKLPEISNSYYTDKIRNLMGSKKSNPSNINLCSSINEDFCLKSRPAKKITTGI